MPLLDPLHLRQMIQRPMMIPMKQNLISLLPMPSGQAGAAWHDLPVCRRQLPVKVITKAIVSRVEASVDEVLDFYEIEMR